MTAQAMVSPNIQKRANELLARSDRWATGRRKADSRAFIVFASQSAPGVYYFTDMSGRFCSCPAARLSRSGMCCHRVAAAQAQREAQNRPFRSYDEIMDAHDTLNDVF